MNVYSRPSTSITLAVILILTGCHSEGADPSSGLETTIESVNGTPLRRSETSALANTIEAARSTVELYHQTLRGLAGKMAIASTPPSFVQSDSPKRLAEVTAEMYLSGDPNSPDLVPHNASKGTTGRLSILLDRLEQVCRLSPIFQARFNQAFGVLDTPKAELCPIGAAGSQFLLDKSSVPTLTRQSMNGRTATQRMNLLFLSTLDNAHALAPLLALPTLNLGQRSKVLFGLNGLDIALLVALAHGPHRANLTQRLTTPTLTERERDRVAFGLAWYGVAKALPYVPSLFDPKGEIQPRSNHALSELARRIEDQETIQQILKVQYAKTSNGGRITSHIDTKTVGASYWANLITQTLTINVNHGQAWRDLAREGVVSKVDWEAVLNGHPRDPGQADLIRRLVQHKVVLSLHQCESYRTTIKALTQPHAQEALLTLLSRSRCLSDESVQASMAAGSPMATLITGKRSADPRAFFLARLNDPNHQIASLASQALLLDQKTVALLTPIEPYAQALSKQLQPKVQNFYTLRLLKQLVMLKDRDTKLLLNRQFIARLTPFATGAIGEIHTDALLILERLNTPDARKVIRVSLMGLKPGQVRVKLMSRFGQFLSPESAQP
jgi:hypothetical protein